MWRNIASNAITFFVVLTFLLGGAIMWGQNLYQSAGPLAEPVCLRIESGATLRKVSDNLKAEGAVGNGTVFRIGADYQEKDRLLKAGSWLIPESASMESIIDIITRGGASTCGTEVVYRIGVTESEVRIRELDPQTERYVVNTAFDPAVETAPEAYTALREKTDTRYRIAVAEGATSWQIAQGLKQIDVLEGTLESVPAEGTLAPDSYEVKPGETRASLITRMQDAQETILAAAWAERAADLPLDNVSDLLILASVIEKETGLPDERGQVASVFVNRLRRGMRLQTDPTVIYGVTEGKGSLGRGLRQSELRRATKWNTYVIDGLPATPIANPGRASINAAAAPVDTDFVFFVADGSGGHAFSTTLAEHNANVAKWRQVETERSTGE